MSSVNTNFTPSDVLTQGWLKQVSQETKSGTGNVLSAEAQAERATALEKACKDFESVFLSMMFKEMRKTVEKTELMGKTSMTEDLFTGMLDDEVAKSFANRGGIGLWKMMYKQMAPSVGLVPGKIAEKAYGG